MRDVPQVMAQYEPIIQTAADLRRKTFAPLKYIVPGLIVEGLVILAGKPKVRKSWLALDIGLAVAAGRYCLGDRKPQQGSVLYLGLEDGEHRLQRRIDKLLPTFGAEWPEKFKYAMQWLRADQGGIEAIDDWCEGNPDARLVVIDVLARFRVPASGRANAYAEDYAALSKLQELAVKRSITILVIHHTRKGESEDPAEEISGTLGLSGCADAFLVLKKGAAGATLIGRGRDIEDVDLALEFNDKACKWTIIGAASEVRLSTQRLRVLEALAGAEEGLSPSDLAADLGLSPANARQMLLRMHKGGDIKRGKHGRYHHPDSCHFVTFAEKANKPKDKGGDSKSDMSEKCHFSCHSSESNKINGVNLESDRVTGVTAVGDYLGPPDDDPADFIR